MRDIETGIREAVREAVKAAWSVEPEEGMLMVEQPRDPRMGDYSTNIAMRLARSLHKSPMDIAGPIVEELRKNFPAASSVEAVHPGFINFRLAENVLTSCINKAIEQGDAYGHNETGKGKNVLVEWVSANPTGALHCGHARNAAWGDVVCRMYEASGYHVLREFYVNDAGNQINMLGESLISRYYEHFGREYPLPEDGYHAEDIRKIAAEIAEEDGDKWLYEEDEKKRLEYFKKVGVEKELKQIEEDLLVFNCRFQSWMHETFFYQDHNKRINDVLDRMKELGLTYEKDGALWFHSTEYGDDKDRVLRKSDGTFSYLTPDIANHVYKVERGYEHLVNFWGADHHSYITRMQCALRALGYPEGTLDVDLIQMVRMVEDGKEVKMSKRTGNAISLRELCEDIGVDAARWFFVSKDVASHMDLDLKLARQKDSNNPVYYAQYAYTRMSSILHNPKMPEFHRQEKYTRLNDPKELQILKMVNEFPTLVADAAKTRKPNKITEYITSLARLFHSYYVSAKVYNPEDPELTNERLGLVSATMVTLKNALTLIGVSAPEKM